MKLQKVFCLFLIFGFCFLSSIHGKELKTGIINFTTCITESKYGKQEQEAFDQVKNKMIALMNDLEKQLKEIAEKLQDSEYIDSLSPEAEQETKSRFQALNEELGRYQNQYYQVMSQANMKFIQVMNTHVSSASQIIAKKENLSMIFKKEACFYCDPNQDMTILAISEMDKKFEQESKVEKRKVSQIDKPKASSK